MKKIFLRRSRHKIIAPMPIDRDDFFDKVCRALDGSGMRRVSDGEVLLDVKNRVLMVSYGVKIEVRYRRVRYSFGSEGVVMAIIFMVFGGMLLFNGRLDTYLFWAAVFGGILFWADNALTDSRIEVAFPNPKTRPPPSQTQRAASLNNTLARRATRFCQDLATFAPSAASRCLTGRRA